LARKPDKPPTKREPQKRSIDATKTTKRQDAPSRSDNAGHRSNRRIRLTASIAVAMTVGGGLILYVVTDGLRKAPWADLSGQTAAFAAFVGSDTCAGCHQAQARLWRGSHHKLAMDHATETSVRGDFNDATLDHYGVRSRFFRKDGKFLVETDGPDGKLATFEVKYTFGFYPLQQYLIEFSDGRVQALSIAWDSRPKEEGGQHWFHLYPNEEIKHDDVLHWTKLNQNWNFMCAECHSTGLHKNYDAANDRYATTFAEISVGCEACHGAGSTHVSWAQERRRWSLFGGPDDPSMGLAERFSERRDAIWTRDAATGNANRSSAPRTLRAEVETCGLCHARRGEFSEDWVPGQWLSDTHVVSSLGRGLYHADGQMLDEVYNYGSFKQSKMFAAGVTCSDCHEPHGAKLRSPGDGVCLQCHSSDKYPAATHHQHAKVSPPLSCASCHMPTRTYMVVDPRHDHSLRIPRPDLSAKLGTPNACNDCHTDKSADWAASAIEGWHGPNRTGFQNYAEAFHAAWSDQSDAEKLLAVVAADRNAPAIARATALTDLAPRVSPSNINLARTGLSNPDPMVRIGALDMLESVSAAQIWPLASPLLSDPIRGVRIRAASLLAVVPTTNQPAADRERFERAAAEFIAAQHLNADRPESRSALGGFFTKRGRPAEAEAEYKAALRLSSQYASAAVNLADLYRVIGREADGESVLRTALAASPQDAGLHHALGLALVRLRRTDDALEELRRAAELDPGQARYAYVYAVALHSAGRADDDIRVLKESLARHQGDRDTLQALMTFSRDSGDFGSALEYAERLARIPPADPNLAGLIQDLRRQAGKPTAR
jgi:predicted CXXCH cytochrome family protein